jgi:hypothetical protein
MRKSDASGDASLFAVRGIGREPWELFLRPGAEVMDYCSVDTVSLQWYLKWATVQMRGGRIR